MSFVFYDTETTGINTSFDQVLQFAAIRTDAELNELDRFEIRCRILPHVVPGPQAMRVTRVSSSQLIDPSLPSHYEMVRTIRAKLLSWSPATIIGYNSLRFDENLLRQAFYQTLHPPYVTNTNGNARSDALKIVQATSLFSPESLTFPVGDKGPISFKLDRLAPANGFNHEAAHDALADVEATIFICRLIAERAPELWSSFMRFSQKAAVEDYISSESIFCLSEFYANRPFSWLVTSLGVNSKNRSEHYVYDLSVDPADLAALSDIKLVGRLSKSPKVMRTIKSNGAPILMASDDAPMNVTAKDIAPDELERRVQYLQDVGIRQRFVAAYETTKEEYTPSPYVEQQIYDGFFSNSDAQLMEQFHNAPWPDRVEIIEQFSDRRLTYLGRQLLYFERPDLLTNKQRHEHSKLVAARLTEADIEVPWLTLPNAIKEMDELLLSSEGDDVAFLGDHRRYLIEQLEMASSCLL